MSDEFATRSPATARTFLASATIEIGQAFDNLNTHQRAALQAKANEHRRIKYGRAGVEARPELVRRLYDLLQARARTRRPGRRA